MTVGYKAVRRGVPHSVPDCFLGEDGAMGWKRGFGLILGGVLASLISFGVRGEDKGDGYPRWFSEGVGDRGSCCAVGYSRAFVDPDTSVAHATWDAAEHAAKGIAVDIRSEQGFSAVPSGLRFMGETFSEEVDSAKVDAIRERCSVVDTAFMHGMVLVLVYYGTEGVFEMDNVVTAAGELDTLRYGDILRPAGNVELRGVGCSYDGTYYVKEVTHKVSKGGYRQSFTLTRVDRARVRMSEKAPKWVRKLPRKEGYVFAVGTSHLYYHEESSWREAERAARLELARDVVSQIRNLSKQAGGRLEHVVVTKTEATLRGTQIVGRWLDRKAKACYVLCRMPIR